MNLAQLKYAMERVSSIETAKIEKLRETHTKPAKKISQSEKADLIISGKVKVRAGLTELPWHSEDCFDFSKYAWPKTLDEAAFNPARDAVVAQASAVRDQIMLGDAEQALKLLNDFAN